jgi:hypothetical protein
VEHDNDIRPQSQGLQVADLLIAAVADVVGLIDSWRATSIVPSLLPSSTRRISSTVSAGMASHVSLTVRAAL